MTAPLNYNQSGFSMVETLIAIFIAVGVGLTVAEIRQRIMSSSIQDYRYAYANQQLHNLYEQTLISSHYSNITDEIKQQLPAASIHHRSSQFVICWQEKHSEVCL